MNDVRDIKKLLTPLWKGSPIILLITVLCVLAARKAVNYLTPQYESTAKLKLDDSNTGLRNNILYKDFDFFSTMNKIMTEVEVIKSKEFLKKVVKEIHWDVDYFRIGEIKKSEIYGTTPFNLSYAIEDESHYNRPFEIFIESEDTFKLAYSYKNQNYEHLLAFGEAIDTSNFAFSLERDTSKYWNLKQGEHFRFVLRSTDDVIAKIGNGLNVKSVDKDIPVLRVSYKDPVPEKTTLLVNTIAKTYIEDYIDSKTETAKKTVGFIDKSLEAAKRELQKAEQDLEKFKSKNQIIDIKMETDTRLKKMSELEVQLANLEMNESAINELNEAVNAGGIAFLDEVPHVGFGDLLFTEMVKKLKSYEEEKKKLLIKYQEDHPFVEEANKNIDETLAYIRKSIENAKRDISTKRGSIAETLEAEEASFGTLPALEKELMVLNRKFLQKQRTYNYLTEKRTEANIAAAGNISFHRILQLAKVPKAPVSPNKTLMYFVAGLLGLVTGIALVYLYSFINTKINNRLDIERSSDTPVLGTLPNFGKNNTPFVDGIATLVNKLGLMNKLGERQAIVVSSAIRGEGKSLVARSLAETLARMGWNTALLDFNFHHPSVEQHYKLKESTGISEWLLGLASKKEMIYQSPIPQLSLIPTGGNLENSAILLGHRDFEEKLTELKNSFDLLVIDTPATTSELDAIKLMSLCEHNLFVFRAGKTSTNYLMNVDLLTDHYHIENLYLLLNGVKQSVQYDGYFSGSQLNYKKSSFIKKLNPFASQQRNPSEGSYAR